jgi:hypothetical protein
MHARTRAKVCVRVCIDGMCVCACTRVGGGTTVALYQLWRMRAGGREGGATTTTSCIFFCTRGKRTILLVDYTIVVLRVRLAHWHHMPDNRR